MKTIVIPAWEHGNIRRYTSAGFPTHVPRTTQVPATLPDHIYVAPPQAPETPPRASNIIAEAARSAGIDTGSVKENCCAVCGAQYDTAADRKVQGHWAQCAKECGFWVHASCVGIYYPDTEAGFKSLLGPSPASSVNSICPKIDFIHRGHHMLHNSSTK